MKDLIKTAVRGTGQSNTSHLASTRPQLGVGLESRSIEAQLLLEVGVRSIERRAGYIPGQMPDDPQPISNEERAIVCTTGNINRFLRLLITKQHPGFIALLADKLVQTDQRVPDEWLPLLLDLRNKEILPMLSERSRWLAQIADNPRWMWVFERRRLFPASHMPCPDWRYQTSNLGRLSAFRRLRRLNPALARQQLVEKWATIDISYQPDFIYTLSYDLCMDDEAFLWDCFCHPVQNVEEAATVYAAAYLMSQLPDSRFVQKVIPDLLETVYLARLGQHQEWVIFINAGLLYRYASQRGLIAPSERLGQNTKATIISRLLKLVPLLSWYERWKSPADRFVRGVINDINPNPQLLQMWQERAIMDSDSEMAYAVLNCFLEADEKARSRQQPLDRRKLYRWRPKSLHSTWVDDIRHSLWYPNENMRSLVGLLTWEQFDNVFTRLLDSMENW